MKKEYLVRMTIKLSHTVTASNAKEAEVIARDLGEVNADIYRATEWKATKIKT